MSRRPLQPEVAAALWASVDLVPLEPFPGTQAPWRSVHLPCGQEVAPRYSNVSRGQGPCKLCGRYKPTLAKAGDAACTVDGCQAAVFVASRGLCRLHYNRWWRGDSPDGRVPEVPDCSAESCTERATQGGQCPAHYRRTRDYGTCSLPDCDAPAVTHGGYCPMHRRRADKHGSPDVLLRVWKGPDTCTVDDCDEPYLARGYCASHWRELVRRAEAPPCQVQDCPRRADTAGYCHRHYWRVRKWGDPHYTVHGDPAATQLVYLVVHEQFQAVKVGVGHWWRVLEHLDNGWQRHREWGPLPRQAAFDVERAVLLHWRTSGLPLAVVSPEDMPQAGYSETARLQPNDLAATVALVDSLTGLPSSVPA